MNGIWQRGYYKHILRNQQDFDEAAGYIQYIPSGWTKRRTGP